MDHEEREFETDLIEKIFQLDESIIITEEELNFLFELEEQIINSFSEYGEEGIDKVKLEITDHLLKTNYTNLIKYLGISPSVDIQTAVDLRIDDKDLFTIEESEKSEDFFNNYLVDETINDLMYSLKGYERKSVGSKEIFYKKRKAIIPSARISAIERVLSTQFNKTNFLSKKGDEEQAQIIMFAYKKIFGIILEIPYPLCDTQKTGEILSMVALKLSNLIGLSEGFRTEFLETVKESLKSDRKLREGGDKVEGD